MSRLDTLARRAASELQSEVKSMPVPSLDVARVREQRVRRTIRTSVVAVAAVVVVVGVPIWLGSFAPEEPVAPSTTVPGPVTTIPDVQEEGMLTVETSLGTWQWVRGEEPGVGLPDNSAWLELPEPPLPEIPELVWPQFDPEHWGHRWGGGFGGVPVSSGETTIIPAMPVGQVDWNQFYTNEEGWVESRWRPLDGDCTQPSEVCPTQTATLEILDVREGEAGGDRYRVDGVLDVLVASIMPGDPDAVEFRDEDTGDLVLRLEATEEISAEQLMRAGGVCNRHGGMCGYGMYLHMLYVDGVGWVDPPWQGLDIRVWPGIQAGVGDNGFWLVGIEEPFGLSATLHAWGSADGVNWQQVAAPYPLGDTLAHGMGRPMQLVDGDLVILTPVGEDERAEPRVLRLDDGQFAEVDVDISPIGFNEGGEVTDFLPAPWGWIATTWAQTCSVWVSPDGTTWEEVTTPDGADTGETVYVQTSKMNDDGSAVAEGSVPTPAESVSGVVSGSQCWAADDNSVYLEFAHSIPGTGPVGADLPDTYTTSWLGGLIEVEDSTE